MAAYAQSVWGIEIGNESLKAIRLNAFADSIQVTGFDVIHHGKILTGSGINDIERDELVALSLRKFMRENSVGKEGVVISVPSQNSFARFVDLPPVDEKKIPQVVRLEAGMQIPFDMSEVQWDWQIINQTNTEQVRVGIFAIKNEIVTRELEYFGNENIQANMVQMSPMSLYNYLVYDRPELVSSDKQATAIINIGVENTDLVVCSKSNVWQRCVPMGGNSFTRAIAESFKLNFTKAEKLKRTAAMSKYARQVFQAMRPIFSDFVSEIQRSIGFYSNSNPDTKITHVIALGGGTKLRGLLKYLQQSLQIPVEKPDAFKRLTVSGDVSAAKLTENVADLGVAYGLALQGLGLAKIESNLLPRAIASSMAWASKAKYLTLAACALLAVAAMSIGRTIFDGAQYKTQQDVRDKVQSIIGDAEEAKRKLNEQSSRTSQYQQAIASVSSIFKDRNVIPKVCETVLSVLPNASNNPQQKELYEAFEHGDIATVMETPRKQRKQLFITSMQVRYAGNIETAKFGEIEKATTKSRRPGVPLEMMDYSSEYGGARIMETAGVMEETEGPKDKEGFLVTLTGYSPYESILDLLDPANVRGNKSLWGVVNHLMNLDEALNYNCPFELFEKTNLEHFKLDTGTVGTDTQMPEGIGIRKQNEDSKNTGEGEYILIDPLTQEVISRQPLKDETGKIKVDTRGREIYKENDHWFVLNFKLRWKHEPSSALTEAGFAIADVNDVNEP
ncbi:MAG: type IV pilus assembly protein PilM [Sedimentisphaerales bacterium]|nr:type IV pilus assembly protein PilM [Sedimentisphaerales bacterium]